MVFPVEHVRGSLKQSLASYTPCSKLLSTCQLHAPLGGVRDQVGQWGDLTA